MPNLNNY